MKWFVVVALVGVALAGPATWMQDGIAVFGHKAIHDICMPGSHDAGMSMFGTHTAFATMDNTRTQSVNIYNQLLYGTRYFDVRPVISGGQFHTGHYSTIAVVGTQGANGESIADIIKELNDFMNSSHELVIVSLSHAMNTDLGLVPHPDSLAAKAGQNTTTDPLQGTYPELTQQEWERLMGELQAVKHRFNTTSDMDVSRLTLREFIGNGNASVVFLVPNNIELGRFAGQGFFHTIPDFFDSYSNTDDLNTMMNDQIAKMTQNCQVHFLLSWTLTQQGAETVFGPSILTLADKANGALADNLVPHLSGECYPNIIYTDNIKSSSVTDIAVMVNTKFAI